MTDPSPTGGLGDLDRLLEQSSLGTEGARLLMNRATTPPRDGSQAAAAAPLSVLPASVMSRFTLSAVLPSGGEADILRVTDTDGTPLVLKIYRAGIAPDRETWEALKRVDSPFVVHLFEAGEIDGRAYEVMEYIPGGSLQDWAEAERLPIGLIIEVVYQIMHGLKALHAQQVVHRDLKPTNILLRSRTPLQLALADFGLSRYLPEGAVFSRAGHTLPYTAPETFAGHVSPSRDWWSLGMIVQELATGEPPFRGLPDERVMLDLTTRPFDSSNIADGRLRQLCMGLLVRDPNLRWRASEVDQWLNGATPQVYDGSWHGRSPYLGLNSYEERDAGIFFGRERLIAELVATLAKRVDDEPILVVTGPSGSGKSSLLKAGLLPAIARGDLAPHSQDWLRLVMTPGPRPIDSLITALASVIDVDLRELRHALLDDPTSVRRALCEQSPVQRVILVVDQFEETFTLAENSDREAFITVLRGLVESSPAGPPVAVVIGLRADFYATCLSSPQLVDVLRSGTFIVVPMTDREIRSVVSGPASAAGLRLEPGLTERLLADVGSGPLPGDLGVGILPLLSHTLHQIWQHREGDTLTLDAYRASGGLWESIDATAEAVYSDLSSGQQETARRLLCGMVAVGPNHQPIRRHMALGELDMSDTDVEATLDTLVSARLVVVNDRTAELVHDALLTVWPRLRAWIETDLEHIWLRGQLIEDADHWHRSGRQPSYLYRGGRLVTASITVDRSRFDLPANTCDFLAESEKYQRRGRRVRRAALGALSILVILSLLASVIAFQQSAIARRQHAEAVSRQVAYVSQIVADPTVSALLAVSAYQIAPTEEARLAMVTGLTRQGIRPVLVSSSPVTRMTFSPDASLLAIGTADGKVQLYDLKGRRGVVLTLSGTDGGARVLAFHRSGEKLAASFTSGTIGFYDVATGRPKAETLGRDILQAEFDPSGKLLATTNALNGIQLWDVNTGRQVGSALSTGYGTEAGPLTFSPDGALLAASSTSPAERGAIELWDVATHSLIARLSHLGGSGTDRIAFSPGGHMLALGGPDRAVQLWDTTNPRVPVRVAVLQTGNAQPIKALSFSPDGQTLATVGTDNTVRLWDVETFRQVSQPLTGDGIANAAFSPDDRTIAISTESPAEAAQFTVQLWTLPNSDSPMTLIAGICARANRTLTLEEWAKYIPDEPYRDACAS